MAIVAASVRFLAPSYEGVGSKAVSLAPLFTHLRGSSSVLGSSASCRGTLQRQEGNVILLLPALPSEGAKLIHQEVHQ